MQHQIALCLKERGQSQDWASNQPTTNFMTSTELKLLLCQQTSDQLCFSEFCSYLVNFTDGITSWYHLVSLNNHILYKYLMDLLIEN